MITDLSVGSTHLWRKQGSFDGSYWTLEKETVGNFWFNLCDQDNPETPSPTRLIVNISATAYALQQMKTWRQRDPLVWGFNLLQARSSKGSRVLTKIGLWSSNVFVLLIGDRFWSSWSNTKKVLLVVLVMWWMQHLISARHVQDYVRQGTSPPRYLNKRVLNNLSRTRLSPLHKAQDWILLWDVVRFNKYFKPEDLFPPHLRRYGRSRISRASILWDPYLVQKHAVLLLDMFGSITTHVH